MVYVRDVARIQRLALETKEPSGGRYLAVAETAWFLDMMRPIKARLGEAARKVPSGELPNFLVKLIGIFDPAARSIVPELGYYPRFDNSRTRKALCIDHLLPVTEAAPAMASMPGESSATIWTLAAWIPVPPSWSMKAWTSLAILLSA